MKCFYHNDLDGECSAAIVHFMYGLIENSNYEHIPMGYENPFPLEAIKKDEKVVIVDFSLQKPGDFDALLNITRDVIWIDHHKTSIEKHKDKEWVMGVRDEGGKGNPAACLLTWRYFKTLIPEAPKAVKLISDYDSWTYKYEDTALFKLGMDCEDTSPQSPLWEDLFLSEISVSSIIKKGKSIDSYKKKYYKSLIKGISFKVMFEGYTGIACNAAYVNSTLFDTAEKTDLMLPFYFNGKIFTVSIYSENENIDCSEIAKKYGGGGHKGAAGFQCENLPFSSFLEGNK